MNLYLILINEENATLIHRSLQISLQTS